MEMLPLQSILAGLAVAALVLAVFWPQLAGSRLEARIRAIEGRAAPVRPARKARKEISLKSEPRRLFKLIVDRFNLTRQAESSDLVQKLRMAGYRGQGPVLTFVAARLLSPPVLFLLAAIYLFAVAPFDLPPILRLAMAGGFGALGYYAPDIFLRNRISKRQTTIRRGWPEALDLMLICVESGMSIEGAFRKVAQEIGAQSPELAEELALTNAELAYLENRRQAYENLGTRTGLEGVKATMTSLIQAEKYGTSIGQSLRVLAQENRDMRMNEAEKRAAALPPKLTVPMILFFLPVLFAVIITPAIIQVAKLP
ncbi:type II secretion system F family protein [Halodurantibacterium flavum]|uniref:Type II secretion system F family protein n=1 Tax=Halodurantibacterium flavum TaxID=1382802 RepID=A0ABW4S6J8_9RHOB